jgi:hypothetical protein
LSSGKTQVQIALGASGSSSSWTNINSTTSNYIEVVWQSAVSLQMYVNGVLSQTITTSNSGSVAAIRMGSVTSTGASSTMYFDGFTSKRSLSPLFGP